MNYRTVNYGTKAKRRNYSKMRYDVELPNLIEIQTESYKWFTTEGLTQLFNDISPIIGQNGDMRLYLSEPILKDGKSSIADAKKQDLNFDKQLYVKARLEDVLSGEIKESEIYLCAIPYMTPSGTFIINGAERVVVSQIIRSAGIYYNAEPKVGVMGDRFTAQVIPTRGAWLEYEVGSKTVEVKKDELNQEAKTKLNKKNESIKKEMVFVKFDRSKKVAITTFIEALGLKTRAEIENIFGNDSLLLASINEDKDQYSKGKKNHATNRVPAVVIIYERLRNEIVPEEAAREFLRSRLFDKQKYDLQAVGRYTFNKKLDCLNRILGHKLGKDLYNDKNELLFAKNTIITKDVIKVLKENRHLLRREIISKDFSLEHELASETLASFNQSFNDGVLYAKEEIKHNKTGEVLLEKGKPITQEIFTILRKNRTSIDEKYVRYYLDKDPYEKEKSRKSVYVEIIDILVANRETNKEVSVRIVGNDNTETKEQITLSDIFASISYYLNLYKGVGSTDDIDNLGNRRLRLIGELLRNAFRIGLARSEKNIKDRMSTINFREATFPSVVNMMPLEGQLKAFFGSSQLSQFMDQINPLAELTQKRRISALGTGGLARDRAGVEVRDVHNSHYGRVCPIETPEGQSIGLISSLASYAKVDKYGFIQTPYFVVDRSVTINGKVKPRLTSDYSYLTASEEADAIIASASSKIDDDGYFIEDKVVGRKNGETSFFETSDIEYMDVSPKQIVSVATSTIPFLEHDDATRALMGANMQRQAVPLLVPESPIVGTGVEHRAAKDSGSAVVSKTEGFVVYVDAKKIVILEAPTIKVKHGKKVLFDPAADTFDAKMADNLYYTHSFEGATYDLVSFGRSNQNSFVLQKPIVKVGEYVNIGDILADGPSTDQGELALGRNVNVAFMTWEGYNYEDAIIISEDLVKNDVYTSVHIDRYEIETRELKGAGTGKEEITREIPHASSSVTKNLDERGIIYPGSEVKVGDVLVGKVTPKGGAELSPTERLIYAIIGDKARDYRDSSLRVPHGGGGIVQKIEYYSKADKNVVLPSGVTEKVIVYVAKKRKITDGDKMAGRHGNKGVISRVLPREDMPYMADGTPIDIMLNPLGIPSRMNIGQVLELHLGLAAKRLGIKIATPVFDGVKDADFEEIRLAANNKVSEKLQSQIIPDGNTVLIPKDGKITLYDGRTGEPFDGKIAVGVMYMIKLSHMVDDKIHARSVGPYTLVTQQPMGGKAQNGGQRFGEMEVWALYAYGAANTLREILTIKSDDMIGRNRTYSAITKGNLIPSPNIPESFRVLTKELQALGLYVELVDAKTGVNVATKSLVNVHSFKRKERN